MAKTVEIAGVQRTAAEVRKLARALKTAAKQSLRVEAETIMTDSKQNYVPVDLGTLRGSGYVGDVQERDGEFSIEMGYGGAASAYALAIHEHPSEHSPQSWKGSEVNFGNSTNVSDEGATTTQRGPKYLTRPLESAAKGMMDRVKDRMDKIVKASAKPVPGGGTGSEP